MATKSTKTKAPRGKTPAVKGKYKTYEELVAPRLKEIYDMRVEGLTINAIVAQLGIGKSTFYEWRKAHPEITDVLKDADVVLRESMVSQAHTSLFNKLTDRTVSETTTETVTDVDGSTKVKTVIKERFIPADTTAIIFTLRNRDADVWNTAENKLATARIRKIDADIASESEGNDLQEQILNIFGRYGNNKTEDNSDYDEPKQEK